MSSNASPSEISCVYCRSHQMKVWGLGLHHPVWKEMTAIDLYRCQECQSLTTYPMPSPELLGECYSAYSFGGYPEEKAKAKSNSNQDVWYDHILNIFGVQSLAGEAVADIGAGEGLLAKSILNQSPDIKSLICVDYHPMPQKVSSLLKNHPVTWTQKDLSQPWDLDQKFDRIFCIAVIEHVIDPQRLVQNLIRSVKPGGHIHILAPVADSILFTILKKKWPYLIPGEHLSLPSLKGMESIVQNQPAKIEMLKKSKITYSTNYILGALFGFTLPKFLDLPLRLPIGIFAMTLRRGGN